MKYGYDKEDKDIRVLVVRLKIEDEDSTSCSCMVPGYQTRIIITIERKTHNIEVPLLLVERYSTSVRNFT